MFAIEFDGGPGRGTDAYEEHTEGLERSLRASRELPDPQLAVQALLTEYGSLRQESLAAIGHRIQIVNFTFVAASVAVAGLAASEVPAAKIAALCLTAIPLLTFSAGFIWLGEHQRSQRAGRGMIEVEKSINRFLGEELVLWETSLARRTKSSALMRSSEGRGAHMKYPYLAAVTVIFGAGLLSQLFGLLLASGLVRWWDWSVAIFLAVLSVTLLCDFLLIRAWKKKWDEASRHDASSRAVRAAGDQDDSRVRGHEEPPQARADPLSPPAVVP